MASYSWIGLALVSAFFLSMRYMYIKRFCDDIPSPVLIFFTRLTGTIVYLIFLSGTKLNVHNYLVFSLIVLMTMILTAFATVWQIHLIQKYPISLMTPILSFIPVFMLPWTFLFFGEAPSLLALIGILLVGLGALLLKMKGEKIFLNIIKDKSVIAMLGVACVIGLTTTSDRVAITASSPLTYAFIWTLGSTLIMGGWSVRVYQKKRSSVRFSFHIIVQGVFWAIAFLCQMLGIEQTLDIPNGVTYVKLFTMFHILISVILGGLYFKEENLKRRILAAVIMMSGAVLVVLQ